MGSLRMIAAVVVASSLASPLTAAVGESSGPACATPQMDPPTFADPLALVSPSDCSATSTNPGPEYDPTDLLTLPVVVHIIMDGPCTQGAVSDALVLSQIEVMNEDFLALPGSPGSLGTDSQIRFELAQTDPEGNPTTGITRHCNTTWYNDDGSYYDTLAWDPTRYINIYTNSAGGSRGYVPFLPADAAPGEIGSAEDRVVVNWLAFGRNGPFPPHDQGRTVTHEVGHYLGLYHPYKNGCGIATAPDCYVTGDLLCDTPPDATSHDLCPGGATSCGGFPVPVENYMELTDDLCMTGFTAEQVNRMRCTLLSYRSSLLGSPPPTCSVEIDFETGTGGWAASAASTCSTGSFVVGTPTAVTSRGVTTQPAGDHTTGSGNALFTAPNSRAGTDDVDGGVCIAESGTYSVAEASTLSVWTFHGQRDAGDDPAGDFFRLEISLDGGTTWSPLRALGDVTSDAVWTESTAAVPAGSDVRLRLEASDAAGSGDLVEAGVDDLTICAAP